VTYDVAIVGGGVMGAATAYHLLRAEPSLRVVVVERDPTYRYASTVLSDGNVRIQFNLEENIRLSQHTMAVLETFADDMETTSNRPDVGAKHQGNLFMTDTDHRDAAIAGMEAQRRLGCEVGWMDAAEVAEIYPAYASVGLVGGTLGARDGSVDPSAVLRGYRAKSIELGAEYVADEATALLGDGTSMAGVRLAAGGDLAAPVVVNAAGAWAAALAATVEVSIPITPVMRTVYVVSSTVAGDGLPSLFLPSGLYVIPESGRTWLMAWSQPDDPVGFEFTPASRQRFDDLIWPELFTHVPAFDQLRVESSWAGLYAVNTLDGNAILGEWPERRGLYLANGFSGHGFQHAPGVGRYLAELILELPHELDLSRFGPRRIVEGRPLYEHAGRLI
jgi:glycine/D-amino acid oxidase-like deaminating enzyme